MLGFVWKIFDRIAVFVRVSFAQVKGGQCCDATTQTAPAITLSKMYGGGWMHDCMINMLQEDN